MTSATPATRRSIGYTPRILIITSITIFNNSLVTITVSQASCLALPCPHYQPPTPSSSTTALPPSNSSQLASPPIFTGFAQSPLTSSQPLTQLAPLKLGDLQGPHVRHRHRVSHSSVLGSSSPTLDCISSHLGTCMHCPSSDLPYTIPKTSFRDLTLVHLSYI